MKTLFLLRRKNHRRFKELMYPYYGDLYRFAYSRLGNSQDAEDAVQDTFVKAFKAFDNFNDQAKPKAWLSCILINTIRDHIRKSNRSPKTVPIEQVVQPENPDDAFSRAHLQDPSMIVSSGEVDPELLEALAELPDTFLNPLLLREIHDCTYQEIAAYLDIPIGTVMSRLSRARSILRDRLNGVFRQSPGSLDVSVDRNISHRTQTGE